MTLFLYILAASSDPDNIDCMVPYRINDERIFFGPCKRRLREWLCRQYLSAREDYTLPEPEHLYVVGFNGSNSQRLRRIVWAGRIAHVMTFEYAYNELTGPDFWKMREEEDRSPLHLKPIYDDTTRLFRGYEHASDYHCDEWVTDVTTGSALAKGDARVQGDRVLLHADKNRHLVFTRDCCFLCEDTFFARRSQGGGIPINGAMVDVLRRAQLDRRHQIDSYAVFGRQRNGNLYGRAGGYLTISGPDAETLIHLIQDNRPTRIPVPAPSNPRKSAPKDRGC